MVLLMVWCVWCVVCVVCGGYTNGVCVVCVVCGGYTNGVVCDMWCVQVVLGLREELHSTHSQLSRLQEEADNKVFIRASSQEARGVVKKGLSLEVKPGALPSESRTSGVVSGQCVLCVFILLLHYPREWIALN